MKDIAYRFFGRLFAIEPTRKNKSRAWLWWCHCECGEFTEVSVYDLVNGKTSSCGCLQRERTSQANYSHGDSDSSGMYGLYLSWVAMRHRCSYSKDKRYNRYGGRGIQVCPEWEDYLVFKAWAVLSGWEDGLTIDRIDSTGNYCPENCRWISRSENSRRGAIERWSVK